LFMSLSPFAHTTEKSKPVFVKSVCNGKISSDLLSSLRDEIRSSQKYQLVSSLDDNGRMDLVVEVLMSCAERENVVAVATVYGIAKCSAPKNCHASVDGYSLNVALCASKLATE